MLVPMLPMLIRLPSPSDLSRVNRELAQEVEERRAAEALVRRSNEELEVRVAARTAEQHELTRQLMQSQKMEAVGRLAGGVAHDFNNLLTVILGYNEMLRERLKGDAAASEYAMEVFRAAERASALTNQLLAFSRRQASAPRVVDLNQVVQQIEKMLGRIIGEDIELILRLEQQVWPIELDPSHIDQVIMNLAVNSRDAMPEGGTLTIETANVELSEEYAAKRIGIRPGRYVMLAVTDSGAGMDQATLTHIFEPFFTTKEQGKGTGLGLSIVYGVVKQHGGEILVYSEPGHGTVFKIYFPAGQSTPEPLIEDVEVPDSSGALGTILLVEDEDQVRKLAHTMLTRRGYRVLDASSPSVALDVLRNHPTGIDLLLTDMVMPQMSGAELAREVRLLRPEIRILFMSGYTDRGLIGQGNLDPGTPLIQKPFTSEALYRKVRDVLR
jgi:signal transduction histidine kinase